MGCGRDKFAMWHSVKLGCWPCIMENLSLASNLPSANQLLSKQVGMISNYVLWRTLGCAKDMFAVRHCGKLDGWPSITENFKFNCFPIRLHQWPVGMISSNVLWLKLGYSSYKFALRQRQIWCLTLHCR